MAPMYEHELMMLIPGLLSGIPSGLLGIASYVLTAVAIYVISRRRGLNKPWLAWIPVVNVWLLGSLADQYRYVVKGEIKSRRKWLLGLNLAVAGLSLVTVVVALVMAAGAMFGYRGHNAQAFIGPLMGIAGLSLPLAGAAIAYAVLYFIALYDVYKSLDPDNAVLFLVLSILFRVTEPFFLFFSREKDNGMPPRRQEYAQTAPQEPVREPWEQENKDYL